MCWGRPGGNWRGEIGVGISVIYCVKISKKSILKYFQFEIGSQRITGITKNTQFGDDDQVAINTNSV